MLQAEERRSVKQKAQAFTSGQSRSRPDSGTVERCARQPRCTAKILCAFDAIALQLPKERRRPAVAQGAAAHGHVRHFGKPPFRSACCLAALFRRAERIHTALKWKGSTTTETKTNNTESSRGPSQQSSQRGPCAGGALITAKSSSCSRALNTCAGGALMGAKALRTAIPGSPARCGGGALTGGAR